VHLTSSLAAQICFLVLGYTRSATAIAVAEPVAFTGPRAHRHSAAAARASPCLRDRSDRSDRPSRARALTFLVAQTGVMLAGLGLIVIHESTLLSICGVVMAVGAGGAVVAAARAYRDRPRAE